MLAVTTVGLDLAKSVFQFHGADALGRAESGGERGIPGVASRNGCSSRRHLTESAPSLSAPPRGILKST